MSPAEKTSCSVMLLTLYRPRHFSERNWMRTSVWLRCKRIQTCSSSKSGRSWRTRTYVTAAFLRISFGHSFFVSFWQRREVAEMHEKVVDLQREVLHLQEQLNKQREYCSNHHIYDPTSPLMTADVIIQSPAHAADEAAIGLLDLAHQVILWHNANQHLATHSQSCRYSAASPE